MLKSLLPKEFAFFNYFEQHIAITIQICKEFKNLTQNPTKIVEYVSSIDKLENDADTIIHTCTEALHKTFITPIERTDIFSLIKHMDDIADNINTAVNRMKLYEIGFIRDEAGQMADVLIESTQYIEDALKALRHINNNSEIIKEKCSLIHKLENDADEILRQAIYRLFKESDAILVIKWKEVFERIEKAVDRCEAVANIIEGVLIDNG